MNMVFWCLLLAALLIISLANFGFLSSLAPEYAKFSKTSLLTKNYFFSWLGVAFAGLVIVLLIKKNANRILIRLVFGLGCLVAVYLVFMNLFLFRQLWYIKHDPDYLKSYFGFSSLPKSEQVKEEEKQLGGATDSVLSLNAVMFWNALERYKYEFKQYPGDLTHAKPISQMSDVINLLVSKGFLKSDFPKTNGLDLLFVSKDLSERINVCFRPKSEKNRLEANQAEKGVNGQRDEQCSIDNSCYICVPKN